MIDFEFDKLSINRQCELIGLCRSTLYYEPAQETPENLEIMRLIDKKYTLHPFFGSRRMRDWLAKELAIDVNRKRIQRLMRFMGLEAIYPKPRTTEVRKEHKKYPYLLRGLEIVRPNQVWSADITYIPMQMGFMYLVAIIDWFSRYVLSWRLSNTMDSAFCLEALNAALKIAHPDIYNTDQGCQFTCAEHTGRLEEMNIQISMDGRGRAFDNIFIERLWRSLKYEDIYINSYESVPELTIGIQKYFRFYNLERQHQSLNKQTPFTVYQNGVIH